MEQERFSFQIFITTIILFLFIVHWTRKKSRTRDRVIAKLPPGPRKLPVIGNLHQMVGYLPHRRLTDLAKKHGPIMHLQLGELSNVIVSSPELAEEILKTHDISFADRPFNLTADIVVYKSTDVGFSRYGNYWKLVKKICVQELLSAQRTQTFRGIRELEVSTIVRSIKSSSGSSIDLNDMILPCTSCIIFKCCFGKLSRHEEAFIPLLDKILRFLGGFSVSDIYPSVKVLHSVSGMEQKLTRLHQETDEVLEKIINEHKARKTTINNESNINEINLIDVLLDLKDRGNLEIPITIDNIKAVILDMFLGGSDTISTTVDWTMAELLRNPDVMEKAQEEVRRVYRGKEHVDESSLQELKYLKLVIKETLRLHPPAPLLAPREAREQVAINGYDILPKTTILVNNWSIGRDSRYWIEPERFYPERFLSSSIDYKGTDFKYLPFGSGRRMCPGIHQGITNIEFILANLLYHFDWKLPNAMKPEDIDMSEHFGLVVKRVSPLYVIPIPYLNI